MYVEQFKVFHEAKQFTMSSSSVPWWCILYCSLTVCGGCVLTKYFAERPLVTSCTCYDCVLTFGLLSKYWIRSSIHRGLIGASHEVLSHLNPQLWGGGCIPPICVCVCRGVHVLLDECSLCGPVMSFYKLST